MNNEQSEMKRGFYFIFKVKEGFEDLTKWEIAKIRTKRFFFFLFNGSEELWTNMELDRIWREEQAEKKNK